MKIGIISINSHTKVLNMASPLHTFVFQQFLNQHGIDNVIIDYKPCYYKNFDARHPYDHFLKHPHKDPKKQAEELAKWKALYKEREKRFDLIQQFIDERYVQTDTCYTQELLDKKDPGCDIYMCVTDVIWKYNPNNGFDRGFFLNCKKMKGKGKIAYAASRGAKGYTVEQAAYFRELIQSFDYISLREKSLYEFVNRETKKDASLVADPVFLQDADFYEPLCKEPKQKGYVLVYLVMQQSKGLQDAAIRFAEQRNLKVIELNDAIGSQPVSDSGEHEAIYGIGIEDWLGYMKHADYIFTNSFHCCCFSIIFGKQFFVGPRGGDKVDWVLEMFGLSSRRLLPGMEIDDTPIDFAPVEQLRKQYQAASAQYVLTAIKQVTFRLKHPQLARVRRKLFKKKKIEGIENQVPQS